MHASTYVSGNHGAGSGITHSSAAIARASNYTEKTEA